MFISSPGNPTGWMRPPGEQKAILDFARARGIAIIGDEVYGTMVYDGAPHAPSCLQLAEADDAGVRRQLLLQALGDDRLAHRLAGASQIVGGCRCVAMTQAGNTGTTTFNQYGALAALSAEGDAFRATTLRERCRQGRQVVADFIARQNRVRWMKPDGAFYGFLHIDGMKDSLAFAQDLVVAPRSVWRQARPSAWAISATKPMSASASPAMPMD